MYGGQTQSIQRLRRVMDFINGNNNCNSPVPPMRGNHFDHGIFSANRHRAVLHPMKHDP